MNMFLFGAVLAVYVILVGTLGYLGYRGTAGKRDYLVAGREIHPFVMAMSYGAAFISTSAIVGFGGMAGLFGMGLLWLPFMNIAFGIFIAFVFFGRRTRAIGRRIEACTFPEFLGKRFHSKYLKLFAAAIIFGFMPLYSSVVLIGGARFIEEILKINYHVALLIFALAVAGYVIWGGLKGVMYVDAFMGTVMAVSMSALLVACYVKLGGVVGAHQALTDLAPLVPEGLKAKGHLGWTAMPDIRSEWFWTLVSSLILGVGIGALAQPQLAVRFMTVKSTRELNRAILVGAVFILLTAGVAYMVGALSNVWFYRTEQQLSIQAAKGNVDLIVPLFINRAMPPIFVYIFALTLLSAAMSTLSSLFHVTGTSLGHDICGSLKGQRSRQIGLTRSGIIIGIVLSILLAYILPPGIVARGTAIFFGVCAVSFLPAYTAALYWKRATAAGVWASMASGAAVTIFSLLFLHRKESAALGLCKLLTGKTELVSSFPWPFIDSIVYALPLSALVLVVVSLMTRPMNQHYIDKCFGK